MAALNADDVFSMMPFWASCSPRWAIGRAVSQSSIGASRDASGDLEDALDLDRRIRGQHRHTDGGTRMAALVAERGDHEIRGAVHHLGAIEKVGIGIDEATEADHLLDLVEIAKRRLDLGQHVDRAGACRFLAVLDRYASAELALGDQLSTAIEADLARDEQQGTDPDEGDVVGD